MNNEFSDFIILNNGIRYSKEQVKVMFNSQIEAIKNKLSGQDKRKLNKWLTNND